MNEYAPDVDAVADAAAGDVIVVITCFNQGPMIEEAVESVRRQSIRPGGGMIIVDDGSEDDETLRIVRRLSVADDITVIRQPNAGPGAARNAGIAAVQTPFAVVLDGDDRLLPRFIQRTVEMLRGDDAMVAASGWLSTFGVLGSVVRPTGGGLPEFLSKNRCPATCMVRRSAWHACGGYDETMRSGFEDWDFFLSLLETDVPETAQGAACGGAPAIGIVAEPLIAYRTAPSSPNITSMEKRLDLMRFIIGKHHASYAAHLDEALLGIEKTSISRLNLWEDTVRAFPEAIVRSDASACFMAHPTYGDGGMAAAVRLASGAISY